MRRQRGIHNRRSGRDRAVSQILGYVMMLSVTAVLVSGIVIGVGGMLESETERVMHDELEVVGQQIAADLMSADRLVQAHDEPDDIDTLVVTTDVPAHVSGSSYMIEIKNGDVILAASSPDVEVIVPYNTEIGINENVHTGGPIEIEYDVDEDEIVVTDA